MLAIIINSHQQVNYDFFLLNRKLKNAVLQSSKTFGVKVMSSGLYDLPYFRR